MDTRSPLEIPGDVVEGLVDTGESCPVTGRPFLSSPRLKIQGDRFRSQLFQFGDSILFDRAEGVAAPEDVDACFSNFDRLAGSIPGPIVLVQDFSALVSVEGNARRAYETALIARQDRLLGVVFIGLRPMFRLFVRMARRLHPIPFPILTATNWKGALEHATSLLEGRIAPGSGLDQAEIKRPFRVPLPSFLLRGYAEELRQIVSEMPWDSDLDAANPLSVSHPFH
ncbi:MAG TPA: hypothetical protein PKY05_13130, partial [Fibrobacteria bacterium]|nr:hypothetical protein [Fibrobacteria bacterium]